ncbi:ATP-binding protein [Diaphorobacter sp.]|uniref:ATP-binding protein n=1 Tax=Diaphorobacter sp. TaxID=1934310 RepID=UPI00258D72DC|nr:ATP-binding protein [Diaphorobacter sp.]
MNAVDAGATKFNVTMDAKEFVVEDNGRGFQSREEIENWFECFGTPHEEGDATYGKFRNGRRSRGRGRRAESASCRARWPGGG